MRHNGTIAAATAADLAALFHLRRSERLPHYAALASRDINGYGVIPHLLLLLIARAYRLARAVATICGTRRVDCLARLSSV